MMRADAVAEVAAALDPEALVVACNGMISRELYTRSDAPTRFYMIGSMGLASAIGLGVALVQPARTVVVFDGDGNVLMNVGGLASVAASGAANFHHVVFDNAAHGSTGNQRTISDRVPLEEMARAAGYRRTARVTDAEQLRGALGSWFDDPGPSMLLVVVDRQNVAGIGRVERSPADITTRFRAACAR
ncbi:MAG TPA: thiamine pyrophosphate-dependent enzyme [Vicinamibacterales bacterium]|nr:thiamine pyrophosphate-dependent enzyme [Vicinamibacterales bacterium]